VRRVLADTNVLIAALGWPHGAAGQALSRILSEDDLVLTDYIVDEFRDVVRRKFPAQFAAAEGFLAAISHQVLCYPSRPAAS
jgi:predicted nucleic acid-binding protein